jgi:hypothetical protein
MTAALEVPADSRPGRAMTARAKLIRQSRTLGGQYKVRTVSAIQGFRPVIRWDYSVRLPGRT